MSRNAPGKLIVFAWTQPSEEFTGLATQSGISERSGKDGHVLERKAASDIGVPCPTASEPGETVKLALASHVGGTSVSSEAGGRFGTPQGGHRNCQNEPGFPPHRGHGDVSLAQEGGLRTIVRKGKVEIGNSGSNDFFEQTHQEQPFKEISSFVVRPGTRLWPRRDANARFRS